MVERAQATAERRAAALGDLRNAHNPSLSPETQAQFQQRWQQHNRVEGAHLEMEEAERAFQHARRTGNGAEIQRAQTTLNQARSTLEARSLELAGTRPPPTVSADLGAANPGQIRGNPVGTSANMEFFGRGVDPRTIPGANASQQEVAAFLAQNPEVAGKIREVRNLLDTAVGRNGEKPAFAMLQEVNSPQMLDFMMQHGGLRELGFRHSAYFNPVRGDQGTAVIWREGVRGSNIGEVAVPGGARNVGRVNLDFGNGREVTVYNAHLDSPATGRSTADLHEAAARAVAADVRAQGGRNVLFGGDMNTFRSEQFRALQEAGLTELAGTRGATQANTGRPIDRFWTGGRDMNVSEAQFRPFRAASDHRFAHMELEFPHAPQPTVPVAGAGSTAPGGTAPSRAPGGAQPVESAPTGGTGRVPETGRPGGTPPRPSEPAAGSPRPPEPAAGTPRPRETGEGRPGETRRPGETERPSETARPGEEVRPAGRPLTTREVMERYGNLRAQDFTGPNDPRLAEIRDAATRENLQVARELREALEQAGIRDVTVQFRAKSVNSILGKLQETPGMRLSDIRDLSGVRVNISNVNQPGWQQYNDIARAVRDRFGIPESAIKDYNAHPNPWGYTGRVHMFNAARTVSLPRSRWARRTSATLSSEGSPPADARSNFMTLRATRANSTAAGCRRSSRTNTAASSPILPGPTRQARTSPKTRP